MAAQALRRVVSSPWVAVVLFRDGRMGSGDARNRARCHDGRGAVQPARSDRPHPSRHRAQVESDDLASPASPKIDPTRRRRGGFVNGTADTHGYFGSACTEGYFARTHGGIERETLDIEHSKRNVI